MTTTLTAHHFTAPDGAKYRIRIMADETASSPREADNVTTLHTFDWRYSSPDDGPQPDPIIPGEYITEDGRVDIRRARKWVALFGKDAGILAIDALHRVPGGNSEGSLVIGDGWRRSSDVADGYVAVTQAGWEMCMGDSPLEGGPWPLTSKGEPDPTGAEGNRTPSVTEVMEQDVAAYNRWQQGEYVGFAVEREVGFTTEWDDGSTDVGTRWKDVDDAQVWGIDGEEYALDEAKAFLPDGSQLVKTI